MVDGPDSAWRNRAPGPRAHRNTARQATEARGGATACGQRRVDSKNSQTTPATTSTTSRKRHTMPHSAQSQHANYWAPRTRKRHQQEHRPQRPTERSDPTQHAKGRTGDRPGPRKGATTRRNVTQGRGGGCFGPWPAPADPPTHPHQKHFPPAKNEMKNEKMKSKGPEI